MLKITEYLRNGILGTLWIASLISFAYTQEAKFQQQSDYGLVCMEAENYTEIENPIEESYWELVTEPDGYSGTGAMQAMPIDQSFTRHKTLDDAMDSAPFMSYTVNFITTGTHYVWLRACHLDGYDDSVWFGLDYLIYGEYPIQFRVSTDPEFDEQQYSNVWHWISYLMADGDPKATIEVESPGVHTFNLYMREQAFKVDKIVLTTDADYIPNADAEEGPEETLTTGTGIKLANSSVAYEFKLEQNYPNPFNPVTVIKYSIPEDQLVTLKIFDMTGKEIDGLVNEFQTAGIHEVQWMPKGLPSGIYFYRIQAGAYSETKKLVLQK